MLCVHIGLLSAIEIPRMKSVHGVSPAALLPFSWEENKEAP